MIAIVDIGCGNIASILFALQRLGRQGILTTDKEIIQSASHVIIPGVAAAKNAMQKLVQADLVDTLYALNQPVLGICLGMQLLYEFSEEGGVNCLGIFSGNITKMRPSPHLAIPHMGWNNLLITASTPILSGIPEQSYMYFTHSYVAPISEKTCATTNHSQTFSSVVAYKNFFGVQFHPERSGAMGAKILNNFLKLT